MEPFIAQVMLFAGNFAPRGWALCNGQLLDITSHSALFSILGTTYGGDGETTFGLPDLRGRVPGHAGNGPGLSPYRLGQRGGAETNTLAQSNLPSHTHAVANNLRIACTTDDGIEADPEGHLLAGRQSVYSAGGADAELAPGAIAGTLEVANTGNSQAVNNMQPFLTVNYIIALTGIFPSHS